MPEPKQACHGLPAESYVRRKEETMGCFRQWLHRRARKWRAAWTTGRAPGMVALVLSMAAAAGAPPAAAGSPQSVALARTAAAALPRYSVVDPDRVHSIGDEVVTLAGVVTGQEVEILAQVAWMRPISNLVLPDVVAAQ